MRAQTDWLADFLLAASHRSRRVAPRWAELRPLPVELIGSIQRFQIGEDSDGAGLITKSTSSGDPDYVAAIRLFVAEEAGHARLLERLLIAGGAATIDGHWTDAVFIRLRRGLGLRLELMTLMIAEVVAVRYYRALRDGTTDPVVSDVAGRILHDEVRHIEFHIAQLRNEFARRGRLSRLVLRGFWWCLLSGALGVVALDHGTALRYLSVSRREFCADTRVLFRYVLRRVLR